MLVVSVSFKLRGVNNRDGTYIYGMNRPNAMLCCAEPTAMPVGPHRDTRLIGMLPKVRPNRAYVRFGLVKVTLQSVNAADMTAWLFPNTPCGREQIVPL